MLRPFLFIGVGGSGGETLRLLYDELASKCRTAGVKDMPRAWQFVHIDCRGSEERTSIQATQRNVSYVALTSSGTTYTGIARKLDHRPDEQRAMTASWRPDPQRVNVDIVEGAGQFRAIGRAVAIGRLQAIRDRILAAASIVEANDARRELDELYAKMYRDRGPGKGETPTAVVFSSLAGGTGSGIMLDVCDLLRGIQKRWAAHSVAMLYAPDVFGGLPDEKQRGVQANALAALSEILALHWGADPTPDPLHKASGSIYQDDRRNGPEYPFIIGSGNARVKFEESSEVFGVVAHTVSAWVTSPELQQEFSSYVSSNWQAAANGTDPLGLIDSDNLSMPFSALGHASVSLGRDLFRTYAAQCLGRATSDRLLYGGKGAPTDEHHTGPDADATVRQRRASFRAAVLDLANSPDLPARLNPDRKAALDQWRETMFSLTGNQPKTADEWRNVLYVRLTELQDEFIQQESKALQLRAEAWVEQVPRFVDQELRSSIAADGLEVTEKLVRALGTSLADEETKALADMALKDEDFARGFRGELERTLGDGPGRTWLSLRRRQLLPPGNERVTTAVDCAVEAAFGRAFDAVVRRLAARLLTDLEANLVQPLAKELTRAKHAALDDTTGGSDNLQKPVTMWPASPAYPVPTVLRPSRTRYVIDPIEDYPKTFADLMGTACGKQGVPIADAVPLAVRAILFGGWEGSELRPLVDQSSSWLPDIVREWSGQAKQPQRAAFRLRVNADELLERCDAWLLQAPGMSVYLTQSLGDALGGAEPTVEQRLRLDRYQGQLQQAITASQPLVEIDAAYAELDGHAVGTNYFPLISRIPLADDTPAYRVTTELLVSQAGVDEQKVRNQFHPTGSNEIEFSSFLDAPCHPILFGSLTWKIRSDWNTKVSETNARANFAKFRRARPLTRAVPLDKPTRTAMVRGWLRAFATRNGDVAVRKDDGTLTLTLPDRQLTFPLLGQPPRATDPFDTLAAVLESLPLLLVAELDDGSPYLPSYRRLVELADEPMAVPPDSMVEAALKKLTHESAELSAKSPEAGNRAWDLRADIAAGLLALTTGVSEGA